MNNQPEDIDVDAPDFEKTMFMLDKVPDKQNIEDFAMQGNLYPEPIDDVAWALPAYLSTDFNLFFVFAPNVDGRWTVTCSRVTIAKGNRITQMSNVVPIGTGLNAIAKVSKGGFVEALAYLRTLALNQIGHFDRDIWRQFEA